LTRIEEHGGRDGQAEQGQGKEQLSSAEHWRSSLVAWMDWVRWKREKGAERPFLEQ
jgi:hypothetical protein